jgi:hypothetical protein
MPYNACKPPPSVHDKPANEVMRVAVHDGGLHFALRRAFDDPGLWGLVFVDAARHVARAFAHEKICTEDEAVERIRRAFETAIRQPPEGSAQTTEIKDTE